MLKQFENKAELNAYINAELKAREEAYNKKLADGEMTDFSEEAIAGELAAFSDEHLAECLARDGYDLDDLIRNGEAYKIAQHTNRPASRERIIKALLDLHGFLCSEENGRLLALNTAHPEQDETDVTDFTVRQLIDWLGY